MFEVTPEEMNDWITTTLDGSVLAFAQEVLNTYLDIPAARQKRDTETLLARRQAWGSILEARPALSDNTTSVFAQAQRSHSTVCSGKGSRCTLCFVSNSMIYLDAGTGYALLVGTASGLSAGALTPVAAIGLAACLTTTTGTLLATISTCGNKELDLCPKMYGPKRTVWLQCAVSGMPAV
ncbi:hypothetical protein ACJZ2D_010704 [Fusarium nematophilum]